MTSHIVPLPKQPVFRLCFHFQNLGGGRIFFFMCILWRYFSFLSIDLWSMVPVVLDAPVVCEYSARGGISYNVLCTELVNR